MNIRRALLRSQNIWQNFRMVSLLALCLCIVSPTMAAKELACQTIFSFLSFGSQSSDSDAVELYGQLWTQLGEEVSPEVVQKIVDGQNPFVISDGTALKSESLKDGHNAVLVNYRKLPEYTILPKNLWKP